jgi:hypothetical protein
MYRRPARRTAGAAWVPVNLPGQPFTALASFADILFGSTTGNRLLRTNKDFIAESDGWKDIHRCDLSVGLAAVGGSLFVATSNDRLWWLDLHGLRQP